LVGVGAAHKFRLINLRYFGELLIGFIASIIIGLVFGYLLIKASTGREASRIYGILHSIHQ